MTKFQPIRGVIDRFCPENDRRSSIIDILLDHVEKAGFKEISLPILESIELFKRSVGSNTDIVQKEMFSFEDLNGDTLCLRPEGTAGCMRAYLNNCHREAPYQRFWYFGNMFRRERPQKGRYRQFTQFGLEVLGYEPIYPDVEMIMLMNHVFSKINVNNQLKLQINYLGDIESRESYKRTLKEYFSNHVHLFDDTHRIRYEKNILRLLDSKDKNLIEIINNAPSLLDHLIEADQIQFKSILNLLDSLSINYTVNPRLVRGLDYYSGLVYEWISDELGAQGTICAGGRYDGLSQSIGGPQVPGLGVSIGIERLELITREITSPRPTLFYLTPESDDQLDSFVKVTEHLMTNKVHFISHYQVAQKKKNIRRAQKQNAQFLAIIGRDHVELIDLGHDNDSIIISLDNIEQMYESRA